MSERGVLRDGSVEPDEVRGQPGLLVWGPWLRYVLNVLVLEAGRPVAPAELVAWLERDGFEVSGRATKTVADALRWEVARGRILKIGRGRYAPGRVPKASLHRMRTRVLSLREEARRSRGSTSERLCAEKSL